MEIRKDTYYTIFFAENNYGDEKRAVKQAQKLIAKGYDFMVGSIDEKTGLFDSVDITGIAGLVCVQLIQNSTVKKI